MEFCFSCSSSFSSSQTQLHNPELGLKRLGDGIENMELCCQNFAFKTSTASAVQEVSCQKSLIHQPSFYKFKFNPDNTSRPASHHSRQNICPGWLDHRHSQNHLAGRHQPSQSAQPSIMYHQGKNPGPLLQELPQSPWKPTILHIRPPKPHRHRPAELWQRVCTEGSHFEKERRQLLHQRGVYVKSTYIGSSAWAGEFWARCFPGGWRRLSKGWDRYQSLSRLSSNGGCEALYTSWGYYKISKIRFVLNKAVK